MGEPVQTTCMRCAVGCGHIHEGVDVGYGIASVRGDVSHPVSKGLACPRGIRESGDPDGKWLTQPLVRKEGELLPTTWDVALGRVVTAFEDVLERNPDGNGIGIGVLGSGQQTNEAAYALGKLARGGFGTRYYDANTTLCMASAVTAYYDAFGSDAPPCTYDDIPNARTHLVWGANPAVAHPVMFRWIHESAQAPDSQLVVVDPVETMTAEQAATHVRPNPGGDLALARAVLARVIDRDLVDIDFIEHATVGFESLSKDLPAADQAATTAGVPLEMVDALTDALADPTLLYWGMGINQSTQGTATAGALIDLCLATGNLRPGSGPFSLTGQANSMGTRVCSSKGTWPGHRSFADPNERSAIAEAWGIPVDRLPDGTGPGPVGIVEAIDDGPIEALWAVATNPVAGLPDATAASERLDETFLVVQDAFWSETVEMADVVLPAATWGESDGTAMNMERTVSRVRPATDTPSGVRSDLGIIATLADRLVPELFDVHDPESVFAEFAALTAGTDADCSGITYDRLDHESAIRWPAPNEESAGGYRYYDPDGADVPPAVADGHTLTHSGDESTTTGNGPRGANESAWTFPTPSGRARFSTGRHDDVPEPPNQEYPLTLTTARESGGYNTGVRTRTSPDQAEALIARINPETLADHEEALRTEDDSQTTSTTIESRRASVSACVEPDETIPTGMVWLPIHHPMTNHLTIAATDPESDEPNYKQCAVRLTAPHADREAGGETEHANEAESERSTSVDRLAEIRQ
ncbi:assimilatory nitrate reductase NasA [Halococcus sp. PRR34]|uniref:assimilatory nitrate reductase NasA n=1 Tax=Halococcus sp. PRR34 TaxID=3020830 RepID=UPI0023625B75|nr:assimilatory nitrate reductase NasA [Halococcus sp. PRR34]